jgi:hypothetical protein
MTLEEALRHVRDLGFYYVADQPSDYDDDKDKEAIIIVSDLIDKLYPKED